MSRKTKLKPSEQLHEDMNKMFEGEVSDDFSLDALSSSADVTASWSPGYNDECPVRSVSEARLREMDIDYHGSDSFPHVHHTLKPHHHRVKRKSHKTSGETPPQYTRLPEPKEETDAPGVSFQIGDPDLPEGWSVGDVEYDDQRSVFKSAVWGFYTWPVPHERLPSDSVQSFHTVHILSPSESTSSLLSDYAKPLNKDEAKKPSTPIKNDEHIHEDEESSPLLGDDTKLKSCIRSPDAEPIPYIDDSSRKKTRVQFDIGDDEEHHDLENKEGPRRRRSHRHRHDAVEDPSWRRHLGSEHELRNYYPSKAIEDETGYLKEHDLDDLTSHRFDDPSAYRRPRVRARSSFSSIIHVKEDGIEKSDRQVPLVKKSYDHNPHEIFVELDELKYSEGHLEWKETARWIKYEEDVEDVANRWGKPHIAFLNFHALFSLRKGLDTGTFAKEGAKLSPAKGAVLLDLEERDLPSIAARVVDKMVACDQIPPDQRDAVIRILLLRHRHIRENQSSFRLPSRGSKSTLNSSSEEKLPHSPTTMSLDGGLRASVRKAGLSNLFHVNTFSGFRRQNSNDETNNGGVVTNGSVNKDPSPDNNKSQVNREESYTQIDIEGEPQPKEKGSQADLRKSKDNKDILKKIPEGAEATAVLVGAVDFLKQPTIAFVRLAEGVIMDNLVEVPIPVRFMFVLLGPFHGEMDYHEVGRSISTLMSDKGFHEVAYRAHSRGQLLAAINEFLNASIVLPPGDWNNKDLMPIDDIRAKANQIMKKKESLRSKRKQADTAVDPVSAGDGDGGRKKPPPRDPLIRTGKPFYGVMEDIKFRYPKYLSDIKDGLSGQVLAAAIFIFFAALSAAITFGGIYGDRTDNYIGVGETLLVSAINGLIFSLFAAQPLLIVGATGPLMIFDMSLYSFCKSQEIDFLATRVWVGIWMTVTATLVSAFELVAIVKKFTRFTEEIFSSLVCLIFIYGAFQKLGEIFSDHPLQSKYGFKDVNHTEILYGEIINGTLVNATNSEGEEVDEIEIAKPNTALLSMILMISTFLIAFKLKHFRNSKFLGRSVRRALGDFGVPIAIVLMVTTDYLIHDTYTDKLTMPAGLTPSNSEIRGWLINPMGVVKPLPIWCIFLAAPASLLLFCLVFLEENICHLILSKPEKNMVKGTGFHWDLILSGFINFVSGILGAPFMGPACVRTVSHTSALTVMSSTHAPGESPKIVGVLEQRLSATVVSVLVGMSVFLTAALNLVPKSVLLGIFLYMGVSATAGIQFLERVTLFLMPVKHHPNVAYVKKVRTWKMHTYTGIQLLMLAILWAVKQSPAALCFPFVLMCLIPIRLFLLPYIFNGVELNALDGTEASATANSEEEEPDFFEEAHDLPTYIDHTHQS